MEQKQEKKIMNLNSLGSKNWLIHILFNRQEYKECIQLIDSVEKESKEKSEFLLFMKGLIYRIEGKISESLELFKQCHILSPNNIECQKEIGKALYLLGKHNSAIEVYNAAAQVAPSDWQIHYGKALCLFLMRNNEECIKSAHKALNMHKHELM